MLVAVTGAVVAVADVAVAVDIAVAGVSVRLYYRIRSAWVSDLGSTGVEGG